MTGAAYAAAGKVDSAEAALRVIADRVDNRGRWGKDDELGTLRLIDDEVRVRALGQVVRGRLYSIGRVLDLAASPQNPHPARLSVLHDAGSDDRTVRDELVVAPHGFATTHADAVGHCFFDGEVYNGRRAEDVVDDHGLSFGAITAQSEGILTRGVLLDVARARGVASLEPGESVTPADLDAAEALAGAVVGAGDAIFVRVGTGLGDDPWFRADGALVRAGLTAECLEWMHRRGIAVYSGDCVDVFPSPYPGYPDYFHQIALGRMGLALLDNPDVERLRELCALEARSTFLLTYAPMRMPGATGSPVNPLVVF